MTVDSRYRTTRIKNTSNLEGKPKCKHFDSPSGATGGDNTSQSTTLFIFFECGLFCPSKRTVNIVRVQAFLSLESLLRASSAFTLFECGLRSLESSSSGQQRLHIIRVRASVPRIVFIGPAAPLRYSSAGALVPRIALSGFQRLGIIRVRALLSLKSFSLG
jgi:hypothetical protein